MKIKFHYLLLFLIVIQFFLYSSLSLVRHTNFQSGAFDLGIFDQTVWQYSQFLYPYNTIKERFILGDHLTLTLPLLAPLFYLWDDVRMLLLAQALWMSLSIIPIYKIARVRNFSPPIAFVVSLAYSLFFGIQYAVYFDFHPIILGVGLLAWLAYFFEAKKQKLFYITLILALLTQENMGIALACLGLIYIFHKQYRKQAIVFIIAGIAASFLMVSIVNLLSPVGYQYEPKLSQNISTIPLQFFDTHDKQLVWLYAFSGFAFLPLLAPGSILAVILDLTQYFAASNEFGHMLTPYLHHRAILAVFLALGTLDALTFFKKKKINLVFPVLFLLIVVLITQYVFHLPINKLSKQAYWQQESWMKDNIVLLQLVPKDASVATTQNLVPHLSHRKEIYLIWPRKKSGEEAKRLCKTDSCWWLDFAGKPQYLMVNLDNRQWITQLLESPENFQSAVQTMEKAGKIKLERQINSARLYTIINTLPF